ncbi:MAG: UDP-N-acetylenolpyruvoylglucosamine reductase [Clostridiales bacterium 43-6]|nr:MAG: UDP-N-acetylenolpyruvoylglucosamine reductase [Clostridiales bacterium 43-6]
MSQLDQLKGYAKQLGCVYFENEPMCDHTTFKIGGPADIFIIPSSKTTLTSLLEACQRWDIPTFILGNGSNLLVSDSGFRGAVISISGGLSAIGLRDAFTITCGAGIKLSALCMYALENSLSGLEFAWGIPGTAGGAAYMNAGAYGGEMKDVLVSCTHLCKDGTEGSFADDELDLHYRHSVYSDSDKIITSLTVKLMPGEKAEIREKMDRYMSLRKEKQPIEQPSAGSTFKRPPGHFAGTLIEECGLKGHQIGGAQVSPKLAGFVGNAGGATASDVKRLMEHIKNEVFLRTNIQLEPEIKIVG